MGNERGDSTTDLTEVKRSRTGNDERLHARKFNHFVRCLGSEMRGSPTMGAQGGGAAQLVHPLSSADSCPMGRGAGARAEPCRALA
jgi:hypothetical protein